MSRLARISAAVFLLAAQLCCAQTSQTIHHTKKQPKPEPTQQELFDYVRSQLLTMSASDETVIFGWGDSADDARQMAAALFCGVEAQFRPLAFTMKFPRADYEALLAEFRAKQETGA